MVDSIKDREIFFDYNYHDPCFYPILNLQNLNVLYCSSTSQFELAVFQVLKSHMSLQSLERQRSRFARRLRACRNILEGKAKYILEDKVEKTLDQDNCLSE